MRFSSAKDVQHLMQIRNERKKQSYHRILDMCYAKIEKAAKLDLNGCIFDVPEFILGLPIYSLNDCIHYTCMHLQQKGFHVQYYFPKILLVSWQKPSLLPGGNKGQPSRMLAGGTDPSEGQKLSFFRSISEFKPSGKFVLNLN